MKRVIIPAAVAGLLIFGSWNTASAWHLTSFCDERGWVVTNPEVETATLSNGSTIPAGGSLVIPNGTNNLTATWPSDMNPFPVSRPQGCTTTTTTTTTAPPTTTTTVPQTTTTTEATTSTSSPSTTTTAPPASSSTTTTVPLINTTTPTPSTEPPSSLSVAPSSIDSPTSTVSTGAILSASSIAPIAPTGQLSSTGQLPATGPATEGVAWVAGGLLLLGSLAMAAARRR